MTYPPRQGIRQAPPAWLPSLLVGAVVLALPWAGFQLRRITQRPPLQGNAFYESALSTGWDAAVAVQTATSRQEWEAVISKWDRAINLLHQSDQGNPQATDLVDAKIAEYEAYRRYARQQADSILPVYHWATITEIGGGRSHIVVDPDPYDTLMSGPPLDIGPDHTIENLPFVNQVLASIGLPPVQLEDLTVLSNYYKVQNYPLGELLLHRSLCRESFGLSDRYDCLLKITVQPGIQAER